MPTYEQLYHLSLSNLETAINRWAETATRFKGLHSSFEDQVGRPFRKADWTAPVFTVATATSNVATAKQELSDAGTEAKGIHDLLKDLHSELKTAKADLHHIADVEAREQGFYVTSDGAVTARNDLSQDQGTRHDPDGQDAIRDQENKRDALENKITTVLRRADEADASAAWGLRRDLGGKSNDFNGRGVVTSLDSADAAHALQLAKKGDNMSNAELKQLDALLKANKNDKEFCRKFALGLGPQGTLDLWAELADPDHFQASGDRQHHGLTDEQKARMKILGGLQDDLGSSLATATQPDRDSHEKVINDPLKDWKQSMVSLGDNRTQGGDGPYGFQAMSSLMREGKYDSEFLGDYGKALLDFEKDNTRGALPDNARGTTDKDGGLPWELPYNKTRLNFGAGNDAGSDPMTGFMEALGHNPDASTTFFENSKSFDYLTQDRAWPTDYADTDAKHIAGYNSLGHALESATTGTAYDDPTPALHRDVHTGNVMEEVVSTYGDDASLMHKQAGIGDSLGRMGAAYVDDIEWSFDNGGDSHSTYFDDGKRSLDDRAQFSAGSATKFLSTIAQNPDAYASMSMAQQAYTTSVIDQNPPVVDTHGYVDSTGAETAVRTGSQVQGILDQSRADQIQAEGATADEKYNAAIDKRSSWSKVGSGVAIATGMALIPTGAGAVVVPLVAGAGGAAITQQISDNIDKFTGTQHQDTSQESQKMRQAIYTQGQDYSWGPAQSILKSHESDWDPGVYEKLKSNLSTAQKA